MNYARSVMARGKGTVKISLHIHTVFAKKNRCCLKNCKRICLFLSLLILRGTVYSNTMEGK